MAAPLLLQALDTHTAIANLRAIHGPTAYQRRLSSPTRDMAWDKA